MPSLTKQNSASESNEPPQDNMKIASSAPRGPQTFEERNVFAIYVSYYIKIKLTLSGMGGEVSLKLPFILGHVDDGSNDTKNRKSESSTKLSDCMRSRTPTEIVEEEYGQDEMNETKDTPDDINDNSCNENANQYKSDTIQLEEQLRFSHINTTVNTNNIHPINDADFEEDDDDAANNESCHNIITAQIHTESQPNQSIEQVTDC